MRTNSEDIEVVGARQDRTVLVPSAAGTGMNGDRRARGDRQ
ncbi:hypothetical protein ACFQHP_13270 [Halomicroarcula sp. GCM10025743]